MSSSSSSAAAEVQPRQKRGRGDTVSVLDFMCSRRGRVERVEETVCLDDDKRSVLARWVAKRARKAAGGQKEDADQDPDPPGKAASTTAFDKDLAQIDQVTDEHLEHLMGASVFASSSGPVRAAFRAAGAGMNFAILCACPGSEEPRRAVRTLFESAAALGIPCILMHATRSSYLSFAAATGQAAAVVVLPHVLALGGTYMDGLPAEMAARILARRFPAELAPLLQADRRPLLIVEDVFSLSRAALARAEKLVAAFARIASARWRVPSSACCSGWGGAQVVVSGCPIRSVAPLQLRRTDDFDFLPCTVEWERWFPVTIEVRPAQKGGPAALLLETDPDSQRARDLRSRLLAQLTIRPAPAPDFLSPFPGTVTVVASQGLADAKMRKQMARLRADGCATWTPPRELAILARSGEGCSRALPSPARDRAAYEAATSELGWRRRPSPLAAAAAAREDPLSSVVSPDHFEAHEQVRRALRFYVPQAACLNEFAAGSVVAFTSPPERRGRVGVVESVLPSGEGVVVRMLGRGEDTVVVGKDQQEMEFGIDAGGGGGGKASLRIRCAPIVSITYVPLEFAAYLDLDVLRTRMRVSVDPFSMEKAPTSLLRLFEIAPTFSKAPDESLLELKDDLACAARYMGVCARTEKREEFARGGEEDGFKFRSSSRTRLEFLKT